MDIRRRRGHPKRAKKFNSQLILANKKVLKNGGESINEDLAIIKHQYDNQGMMKIARRWTEKFYKELLSEKAWG
jgi:hypothetical protein